MFELKVIMAFGCTINLITEMYGFKGARKQGRKYPTAENARDESYKVHDGSVDAYAPMPCQ